MKCGTLLPVCLCLAAIAAHSASAETLLYATDTDTQSLFTLSTTNASASFVGGFGVSGYMAALAYDANNNVLYDTTTGTDNGAGLTPGALYVIDFATGGATRIGLTGLGNNLGMEFVAPLRPQLSAVHQPSARLQISWRTNFVGYTLESTASLPSTNWTPVANSVTITNVQFQVTVDTDAALRIFRLRKP